VNWTKYNFCAAGRLPQGIPFTPGCAGNFNGGYSMLTWTTKIVTKVTGPHQFSVGRAGAIPAHKQVKAAGQHRQPCSMAGWQTCQPAVLNFGQDNEGGVAVCLPVTLRDSQQRTYEGVTPGNKAPSDLISGRFKQGTNEPL